MHIKSYSRIEKFINTIIWIISPKNSVIVSNVHLKNLGDKVRSVNFGDDLNYEIIKSLSGRTIVNYLYSYIAVFKPTNYMCIGSIVDTLVNEQSIIWGSGAMYGDKNVKIKTPVKVLAVRGPLTRRYLLEQGISCPEIYGDPAILLPFIYKTRAKKKYRMGLIPHYTDNFSHKVIDFKQRYGDEVIVIDMKHYDNWRDIVNIINECEFVASSSLHGLIIADAYGVPNVWVKISDNVKGGDFKFQDYFEGCKKFKMTPIDLRFNAIDINLLELHVKDYKVPEYDIEGLINSCPFISKSVMNNYRIEKGFNAGKVY